MNGDVRRLLLLLLRLHLPSVLRGKYEYTNGRPDLVLQPDKTRHDGEDKQGKNTTPVRTGSWDSIGGEQPPTQLASRVARKQGTRKETRSNAMLPSTCCQGRKRGARQRGERGACSVC
ncbi:hypothetical protein TRIATDRAFT_298641 [Trichoderma atroviride IMI 206040]|uniref:Secreted protein n=1 Tax=Hypocrea atroviridis (strain ATCC 20476 / IMI 206040) TaxID=452589 RepID=G9NNC5_HYPAI|nr:uncharacterized protein TRIATDRAFT_298641 [Trichoderma atroviride IMI 206040]EHK47574.1 hypothetical protein TRIATDRAFT_298641 [Trichoderma atroviride IMI 206040]